ncbi:MAG: PQQ-binding-like beta-propeller repeat protein [Rhodanobacteraceae bacterium]
MIRRQGMLFAALFGAFAASAHAGDASWQSDWRFEAPPTLAHGVPSFDSTAAAFAANGDIVLAGGSYSYADFQITRVGPDGALRWSTNVGAGRILREVSARAIIATADGGAFVALGVAYDVGLLVIEPQIVRIGPLGELLWVRGIPADAIVELAPDRLVAAGCGTVTMLDATTGDALWQVPGDCIGRNRSTLAVDESGTSYATTVEGLTTHVVSLTRDGVLRWDIEAPDANVLGLSGNPLYLQTPDALSAIDAGSGAENWTVSVRGPAVLVGASSIPVIANADTALVQRLAPDTGLPVWSTPLSESALYALDEDHVLAVAGLNADLLDVANGVAAWSVDLPASDTLGSPLGYFDFGGEASGTFVAFASGSGRAPVPPFLQRVALADGALTSVLSMPDVPQGDIGGDSAINPAGAMGGTQIGWSNGASDVRTRRLDPATGATLWERIEMPSFDLGGAPSQVYSLTGLSADAIVTVAAANIFGGTASVGEGAAWVGVHDLAGGALRWQTILGDADHGELRISNPEFDSSGNVLVDIGARVPCTSERGSQCGRRTLYKLSGTDGHVVWQSIEDVVAPGIYVVGSTLVLDGDDPILLGPLFDGSNSPALRFVDGSTGVLRWTSSVFARDDLAAVIPAPDGVLVASQGEGWAKLATATGTPLWSGPEFAAECRPICRPAAASVLLTDGDLLVGGDRSKAAIVTRLSGHGSGTFTTWRLDRDAPDVQSFVSAMSVDASGTTWLDVVRRSFTGPGGLTVLARFDPANGAVLGEQVLGDRFGDFFEPVLAGDWLAGPEQGRLVLASTSVQAPQPSATGNAVIDTTVTATGNLELSIDSENAPVGSLAAFDARVAYSGDVQVERVHLNLYAPWGSGVRDVECTGTGASSCTVETRGGNAIATVDLAPGSVVHVTGTTLVLGIAQTDAAQITGVVFGPPGLVESDTLDNFAGGPPRDAIFTDGFDGLSRRDL